MAAADFQRLIAATAGAASEPAGIRERLQALRTWAEGGLAYAQGQGGPASARRAELSPASAPWGVGWPLLVFAGGNTWDLPAIYADPRGELHPIVDPLLPGLSSNHRAAIAAAYAAHLDGDHRGAMRILADAGVDPATEAGDGRVRALIAQFLVAEAVESHDGAAARPWLAYALEGGRAPLARPFVAEMVLLVQGNLAAGQALELRGEACRLGIGPLCGNGMLQPNAPIERPMRPADRFPNRRRRLGGGGGGGGGSPGGEAGASSGS
jgi:hypothetical protein